MSTAADVDDYDDEMRSVFHVVPPSQKKEVKRVLMNKAILSSTTLQMLLYYNFFYSLAFAWWWMLVFRWKYLNNSGLRVTYFSPIFFSIWAITEVGRIYVGYQGNLKEDTPNMAAFLFLTIFPQMLITIYFLSMQYPLYPFDHIFSGIMLFMLCVEFVIAWRCLGRFIDDKTARFAVEYAGVESREAGTDSNVVALNRFIMDDGDDHPEDEFTGVEDMAFTSPARSQRIDRRGASRMPLAAEQENSPEAGRLIAPPSRDGSLRGTGSFGGPTVQPVARSAPRGSAAPPTAPARRTDMLPPLRFPGMMGTTPRELETPEERHARRQRDRLIISGQLLPERRRDQDTAHADEISQEQARLARQQAATLDRLSTSTAARPVIAPLSSPQNVRIPYRPDLAAPPNDKRE